jgi:hypothetical protein
MTDTHLFLAEDSMTDTHLFIAKLAGLVSAVPEGREIMTSCCAPG